MAIQRKREEFGRAVARVILESCEPVELPPAEVDEQGATVERQEFQAYLPELFSALCEGGAVKPVPLVQSDSLFIINGATRTFWVRLWHTDTTRTAVARLHVVNCLPRSGQVQLSFKSQGS